MIPIELLRSRFGLPDFRPGQRQVIDALCSGQSALAVFPTGGGKSLCYQLPALAFSGVTIVVSPLIALMKDQIDFLSSRGIAAARLDSSLSLEESRSAMNRLRDGSLKLLYVAPERFNNERFLEQIQRVRIALFAIDEAHCISEWGHNFRPDYLKLADLTRTLKVERVLALTATATPKVVEDICSAFRIAPECAIITGFYRPNLTMLMTPVLLEDRDARLVERLRSRPHGAAIIYVTLQKTAERVALKIEQAGFPARPYHAGMETDARTEVQEWWMASENGIVVATIAFGMGIDKSDVRYIYHYNQPKSLESYSQEIGRAGRDGAPSIVEMLLCPADVPTLENFAYGDTPTGVALRALLQELLRSGPAEFHVNLIELSNRFDIRPLVLRTALTYIELAGVLRQGTPFYAGYEVRAQIPPEEMVAQLKGEPARFLADLFKAAKKGRTWYSLDPGQVATALGQGRPRVVRALEYIESRGWAEIRPSDARLRFTRVQELPDLEALAQTLEARFLQREAQEISRIQQVLGLAIHPGCRTHALVSYFGEVRAGGCGHCSWCLTGQVESLPPPAIHPPLPAGLDLDVLRRLRVAHPKALAISRQVARFLCGLTSPALTRAKLSKHELFGALEERPFGEVLAWCERFLGGVPTSIHDRPAGFNK